MKILYIITQGEWGGAQKYVFDLASGSSHEYETIVAVGEPNGKKNLQEKLESRNMEHGTWNNIQIVQLRHLVRKISFWHDILAVLELAKLYQKLKPDIVHLSSSKAGIVGSFAKLLHAPCSMVVVYTVHGWIFNEPLGIIKKNFYLWLERITAELKAKIIVLSDLDFETGRKIGIQTNKLTMIPLGINPPLSVLKKPEALKSLARLGNLPFLASDFIIGTIANLYPTKGLDTLVEAVKIIKKTTAVDRFKFVTIGEGEERSKLESLIQSNNLNENVFLIGAVENAEQYLPMFDLFVLPSRKEGLPYVIMEAMNTSVPIISTDVGGIPSLINNTNGLVINADDNAQLANAILWAIKNPEKMKKRAARALEKIKGYTLDAMVAKTKTVYQSVRK